MISHEQKRRSPHLAGFEQNMCLGGHDQNTPKVAESQDQIDAKREQRIDLLRLRLLGATGADERRVVWNELRAEIAARSPAQVERIERARGLRS